MDCPLTNVLQLSNTKSQFHCQSLAATLRDFTLTGIICLKWNTRYLIIKQSWRLEQSSGFHFLEGHNLWENADLQILVFVFSELSSLSPVRLFLIYGAS